MKRFSLVSVCLLVALFPSSIAFAVFDEIDLVVVDTILGEDTFYSFETSGSSLPSGEYRLALRKPDLKIVDIGSVNFKNVDFLNPYRVDSSDLSVSGRYDLLVIDESSNLNEIVLREDFFVNESALADTSGFDMANWLQANLFGIGADEDLLNPDNRFSIDDLPSSIDKDVPLTFEVQALNENKTLDVNYTGTISIEVLNDSNAVIPNDYSYVLQDAGSHRFVEGIVFSTTGDKTIRIEDTADDTIFAEFDIEVVDEVATNESTLLQIDSPVAGTVSNNRILVTGTTEPGLEVTVFEGGAELVKFDADVDGSFSELLPPLDDGLYSLSFGVNDVTSDPINVEINTGGIDVRVLDLSSENVEPSSIVSVEVELTDAASEVSVVLNGVKTDLDRGDIAGTFYSGQITAPISSGQYPVNLLVVDQLGNSTSINNAKILTVSSDVQDPPPSVVVDDGADLGISNLSAQSSDKQIQLSWNSNLNDIVFYSIKYGTSSSALTTIVDTNGNVDTWFVPGLENGVNYFFQVVGIDRDGSEVGGSSIVSATPGRPGDTSLFGDNVDPGETSDTGPGLILVFVFAGGVSYLWRNRYGIMRRLFA